VVDEPSLGEVSRQLSDFRQDVRDDFAIIAARLDNFVLREVYAGDRNALELRLSRMEREAEAQSSTVRGAIYAAISSVVASVVAGIVLALVLKGG
jgi:hypothetical protein